MILYYVRHGDPIYEPDGLTELGKKQAQALAKRLALYGVDEIYCSTSRRAQMTAQPICEKLEKEKILLDWAHEGLVWGEFTVPDDCGQYRWAFQCEDYRKRFNDPEVRALGREWYAHSCFANNNFRKGMERIQTETDRFLSALGFEHILQKGHYKLLKKSEKRIALFAHEGFGKVFLSCLLDIPYPQLATRFELGHSSVTVIYFDEQAEYIYPQVLQWSNDSHLYSENLLTGYQNKLDI